MVRRSLIPALVFVILVLGASDAHAAAYTIEFEPEVVVAGDQLTFHATRVKGNGGAEDTFAWDFGDGATGTGRDPTHVYAEAGTFTVTLIVADGDGTSDPITAEVTVGPNAPPSAAFNVDPASPLAGELATFTGGSDPDGDPLTRSWDFGDGTTDSGSAPSHAYASAGDYLVVLTATDSHGASATTFQTVTVRAPGPPPPGTDPTPPEDQPAPTTGVVGGSELGTVPPAATRALPMRPFPVVRIAGTVLPRGALVRILSVRGPRGMRVRIRCLGSACPVRSIARTSATRLVRFRMFERRLTVGITLKIFVRKPGTIGKYTRFVIRAGKAPARLDRCLVPGRTRPVRCQ